MTTPDTDAERISAAFHWHYEKQAPAFGYKTREATAVPWEDVPDDNRGLMVSVVQALINTEVIAPGLSHTQVERLAELEAKLAEIREIAGAGLSNTRGDGSDRQKGT